MHPVEWAVVAVLCAISLAVGLYFTRQASRQGAEGYFTTGRKLPWWSIAVSNTSTYQSGNGGFVMLVLVYGLVGNWLWWGAWIIWMPLVAMIWARLWRRMQIMTTAELISLRYGGRPARFARTAYAAVCCFGFSVIQIGYITGFFVKTIAPVVGLTTGEILLLFGGITALYTMCGGLAGVVYTDVVQFLILMVGNSLFLLLAVPQFGGWGHILQTVAAVRPDGLVQTPPTAGVDQWTLLTLIVCGLFFAGSPTAGEGMTAQRFMAAKSERHAVAGQLFNAFLALTLRTLPLIGLGVIAMSLFWTPDVKGVAPPGMKVLPDSAHAWGEVVKACKLPLGLIGILIAAEAAAYMSTLSSLINWGSSFVVNDLVPQGRSTSAHQVWISRLTTLVLFGLAAGLTILYVDNMVSWFMYINDAMVIFLLPLAWLRFFWWRFNVWGELAAVLLTLPVSWIVWFSLDFGDASKHPFWQGLALLFALALVIQIVVTLLTPPESRETLKRFYARCRPPGLWGPVREGAVPVAGDTPVGRLIFDSVLGILACLGLVLATNAIFGGNWTTAALGAAGALAFGGWVIARVVVSAPAPAKELVTCNSPVSGSYSVDAAEQGPEEEQ
jgi:SSS family solute:Na+ symporter